MDYSRREQTGLMVPSSSRTLSPCSQCSGSCSHICDNSANAPSLQATPSCTTLTSQTKLEHSGTMCVYCCSITILFLTSRSSLILVYSPFPSICGPRKLMFHSASQAISTVTVFAEPWLSMTPTIPTSLCTTWTMVSGTTERLLAFLRLIHVSESTVITLCKCASPTHQHFTNTIFSRLVPSHFQVLLYWVSLLSISIDE